MGENVGQQTPQPQQGTAQSGALMGAPGTAQSGAMVGAPQQSGVASGGPALGGPVAQGGALYYPGPNPPPQPGQAPPVSGQPPTSQPVGGVTPAPQTGGGVAPGLNQAWQQNQNIVGGANLNPSTNTALQGYYNAAAQPLIQQFQQSTDPSILGNAVMTGNLHSSAPQQQESNAQTALAQGLGNLGANIYEPAYEQALGQQTNAINSAAGLAQAQYLPAQELAGVGSQQQQLQQSILGFPYQLLSGASGLVGPTTGGSGVSIGTQTQPGSMK